MNTRHRLPETYAGILLALGMFAGVVRAQLPALSGYVTDSASGAVAGATVSLLARGISANTDSAGRFRLDWTYGVETGRFIAPFLPLRLERDRIVLHLSALSMVGVERLALDGRRIEHVRQIYPPGSHNLILTSHAEGAGVRIVRVTIDGSQWVFTQYAMPGSARGVSGASNRSPAGAAVKRQADPVDTLSVTKPGYLSRLIPVNEYGAEVSVVLAARPWIEFSINRGARTVSHPSCSLFITDSHLLVYSVRFSQIVDSFVRFDSDDPRNPERTVFGGTTSTLSRPWVLSAGAGDKRVYAEVSWRDSSRSRDTLWTVVAIEQPDIEVLFRGLIRTEKPESVTVTDSATVIRWDECQFENLPCRSDFVFGRPLVEFSLDFGADTSVSDTFEYWLASAYRSSDFPRGVLPDTDSTYWRLETVPRTGVLRRRGAMFDTTVVFSYSIDTLESDGRANLSRITLTRSPVDRRDSAPADTFADPFSQQLARWLYRPIVSSGRKEFTLVLRFRGKEFGDERFVFSREAVAVAGQQYAYTRTFFDLFPPSIGISQPLPGDTAGGIISVTLRSQTPDICSDGLLGSPCTQGELRAAWVVIARKPANLDWRCASWLPQTPPPLSVTDMLTLAHERYLYTQWDQPYNALVIDTRYWPSGEYLIGVLSEDEFGHVGPAPLDGSGCNTNPLLIQVLSGS